MRSDTMTIGGIPDRRLGVGWLGDRFHAVNPASRQEVVLEFVAPGLAIQPGFRERFAQEALVQQQLTHPGLIRVLNANVESETLVLVSEYVEGVPLDEILANRGPLPLDEAFRILDPVCDAVAYVHARGVLHQGIEPSNLLVLADGRTKIGNCGLARLVDPSARKQETTRPGSIHYRAPELLLDRKDAGPQADIYGLGCTLFHMLTGHAPFEEEARGTDDPGSSVRVAHFQKSPPDPARYRPDLPGPVRDAVLAALAKNPAMRPESCGQFSALLRSRPRMPSPRGADAPARPDQAPESPTARPVVVDAGAATVRIEPPRPVPAPPAGVPAATLLQDPVPARETPGRPGPTRIPTSQSPPEIFVRKGTSAQRRHGSVALNVALGIAILVVLVLAVLLVWTWMAKRPVSPERSGAEAASSEAVEPRTVPRGCLADTDCPPGHSCREDVCHARPAPAPSLSGAAPAPEVLETVPRLPPPPSVVAPEPTREPASAAPSVSGETATHEVAGTTANASEPWLNLREGPGGGHAVKAELPDGTRLRVLWAAGAWREVEVVSGTHAGAHGYVHSRWIRPIRR